ALLAGRELGGGRDRGRREDDEGRENGGATEAATMGLHRSKHGTAVQSGYPPDGPASTGADVPSCPDRYACAVTDLDDALAAIETWAADHAAAAVISPRGILASRGDPDHVFRWASVTKL